MENKEEISSESSEDNKSLPKERIYSIIISSYNNQAFIHTNIRSFEDNKESENKKNVQIHKQDTTENEIVDICLQTRRKSVNEIKLLTINPLLIKIGVKPISKIQEQIKDEVSDNNSILNDRFDGEDNELMKRNKNQKLTKLQMKFIKNILNQWTFSIKKLWQKYGVSPSVVYKIRRMSNNQINQGPSKNFNSITDKEKEKLLKELQDMILNTDFPFNSVQATELINKKLQTSYNSALIRKLLKEELNWSFKKVKQRPIQVDLNRVRAMRQLFSVKFWQKVTADTLLINIDETSINRHIKWNYSWSIKGQQKESTNKPFSGSMSIAMSICSNGAWMAYLTNKTIDNKNFTNFLSNLDNWINKNKLFGYSKVLIILDNSSVHKVKEVKLKLIKMKVEVIFLAPYSPQFAPIEMYFGILKQKLYQKFTKQKY